MLGLEVVPAIIYHGNAVSVNKNHVQGHKVIRPGVISNISRMCMPNMKSIYLTFKKYDKDNQTLKDSQNLHVDTPKFHCVDIKKP